MQEVRTPALAGSGNGLRGDHRDNGRASGGLGHEAAERAAQATLQTLAERLPRGEAGHILRELPAEFVPWLHTETDAEAFDIDEFLDRVAQREDVDVETALLHARAVFFALGDALAPGPKLIWLVASRPPSSRSSPRRSTDTWTSCLPTSSGAGSGTGWTSTRRRHARSPTRYSRPSPSGLPQARSRT